MSGRDYTQRRRRELHDQLTASLASIGTQYNVDYGRRVAELQQIIGLLADLGNEEIAAAHDELTKQTAALTRATRRLSFATWILFIATLALSVVTGAELLPH